MTTVELTDDEAKAFLTFRKYQDQFDALLESKIFEIRRGQAVLHFSNDGVLMKIEVNMNVYARK